MISTSTRRALLTVLIVLFALPGRSATHWPTFRGPSADGAVRDVELFQGTGVRLTVGWDVPLGSGYSAVIVEGNRVFALYGEADGDYAAAFDVTSGERIWRYRISDPYKGHDGSHDGPISTPAFHGGRIYGLGAWGHLFALDAATGQMAWTAHLIDDFGAQKPHYGFAASPRVVDGVLLVEMSRPSNESNAETPEATARPQAPLAVVGLDAATGRLLWTAGDDHIEYHSPVEVSLGGVRQTLIVGEKELMGLQAKTGRVLWKYRHDGDGRDMGGRSIVPVVAGDDRVFLTNKIDASTMLRVEKSGDAWTVSELWSGGSLARSYVVPVYHEGHLYGMNNRIFTCVDATTGTVVWRSREPGDGFPILVGRHLVMITKPGSLHIIEASPAAYREVARLDLFQEHSWSEVAYAGGHLFARSMARLARVDLTPTGASLQPEPSGMAQSLLGRFLARLEQATDKKAAIDAFLVEHPGSPIVEDDGTVHFVYRGPAEDVGIVGDMIGFRREDPMRRVAGTDFFHYTTRLEPDAAVTYGFIVDYDKPRADPRNTRAATGLFGEVSWFAMPAWEAPSFLGEAPPSQRGHIERLDGTELADPIDVYLPAGYAAGSRRYPVAYVHSGDQALEQGRLVQALDQLIGARTAPLIAVFIHTPKERPRDAAEAERYRARLVSELIPEIDRRYRTIPEARGRASIGFGGSGTTALRLAFEHPETFRRVGLQSPMIDGNPIADLAERGAEVRPMVVYHDWGTYHQRSPHEAWSLVETNRELWTALREAGYRPSGGERPEGYAWPIWAGHYDELLSALFPPGFSP